MSYIADVFNIMIASPNDVSAEREIIRKLIYEWNIVHSASRKIVLLPIGWETHSSPEMGSSPQDIINSQLLDKCDMLVAVFWTKIGTHTDQFISGTVEEIEKHIQSNKPAMLYFSSQPAALDTVDLDQVKALKEFKISCKDKGLFEEYESHSDFQNKFYRQLQLKLNEHPIFQSSANDLQDEIKESDLHLPALSKEAQIILKEASLDEHGTIVHVKFLNGTEIQSNGKNLITSHDRRDISIWEAALDELLGNNCIIDRGYKGEVYEVTNIGYQIADTIKL